MPSSTSSSDPAVTEAARAAAARASTVSAERLTAADRPGVAQPVPERPVPQRAWGPIAWFVLVTLVALVIAWEWKLRSLEVLPGDFNDGASAWAEQRRRIDAGNVEVAIVGDSRILFDTDLDHFEALTGKRPLQLALPGTNGRPFLENLAADADFKGLVIVGITELSYLRDGIGLMAGALDRYAYESPSQRSSYLLHRAASRVFGFMDEAYRLSALVERLDPGWREGTRGPYNQVWKIQTVHDDRQTWLWPRIETDVHLRAHARHVWMNGMFAGPAPPDDAIARAQTATRKAVATIRARGGAVVFLRPPSSAELRALEDKRLPRTKGWDPLLLAADVQGVHFDDFPAMQGLDIPEFSHLSRACAKVFTDAYVRAIADRIPRLPLRPDAPTALSPADC